MKSFEYDLRYLQSASGTLENYLLSKELFWPLDAHPPEGTPEYPQLTLGGLLLARQRLTAYPATPSQEVELHQVIASLEHIRSKWRVAWEEKSAHSFANRLRMWADFISEYQDSARDHADRYSYEVRLRVMLQLLSAESSKVPEAEVNLLAALDQYLKGVLSIGSFIWDPEIQRGFPKEEYWYLYGTLRSP